MKEFVIVLLSISFVSVLASTANAMRSLLIASDTSPQAPALVSEDTHGKLSPIVYDQPPEDEEHWPGSRD